MNTKQVALALPLILLAQQDRSAATSGRYALSSGQYTAISKSGATSSLSGVFKIDTATGRTWEYEILVDDQGKMHSGWNVINEIH